MRPADVNGRPPLIHISATLTMSLSGDADGSRPTRQFATGSGGSEVHHLFGSDSHKVLGEH